MNRLISWLSNHKLFTALLAGGYLVAVVLFHKEVSRVFDWLSAKLSFKVYNNIMLGISLFFLCIFLLYLLKNIVSGDRRHLKIIYWCFTVALVVVSYKVLIVFYVESIHFPQYAFLVLPVFALTLSFGRTVFYVTLLGAIDEAYQYLVHYSDNMEVYFDFNDIVLNLVGAGIGILIIYTLSDMKTKPFMTDSSSSWGRNKYVTIINTFLLFSSVFLYTTGLAQFYPDANASSAPPIVLSRKPAPDQFWTNPTYGKPFHILHPVEGVIYTYLLIFCYSYMDVEKRR